MCLFDDIVNSSCNKLMSRTIRRVPHNADGHRHPHTQQEKRQLNSLKADESYCEFDISPRNRLHRHIADAWDDLTASSWHQMDYAN